MAAIAISVKPSPTPPPLVCQDSTIEVRQQEASAAATAKTQTAIDLAQQTINQIRVFTGQVNIVIPNERPVTCIQGLFSKNIEQLEAELKKTINLEEIRLKISTIPNEKQTETPKEIRTATAEFFSKTRYFAMQFDPSTGHCIILYSFRRGLPTWVKCGKSEYWLDQKRGIPTAKVLKGLLMAKLGITKKSIKSFESTCIDAQTILDVIYNVIIKKQSIPDAFANSHTVKLVAEVGEILGIKKIHLTHIQGIVNKDSLNRYSTKFSTVVAKSGLSQEKIEQLLKHPYVKALQAQGIDLTSKNIDVLEAHTLTFEPVTG